MRPRRLAPPEGPVIPAGLLRLHRHGLVNVLVIAQERSLRLACAAEFHRSSVLRNGAMVAVDCPSEEDLLVRALLGWSVQTLQATAEQPLWPAARGTLVLDRVTALSSSTQKMLHDLVRRSAGSGDPGVLWCGRLIATCDEFPEVAVDEGRFSAELLDCLDKVRVVPRTHAFQGAA